MPQGNVTGRRQVLRAAGCTIALPALASVTGLPFLREVRGQEARTPPKRFCCIFFPNGVSLPPEGHPAHGEWHWFPHGDGPDYAFTRPLEPLAKHRDRMTILSGLSHPSMRSTIAHIAGDSFLSGADSSRVYTGRISLDQVMARRIGDETRFPSLTLSSDGGAGAPGRAKTLSFSGSGRPIPSLSSPRAIFNRLFGVTARSVAEERRAIGRDRSLLDSVLAETAAMRRRASPADRRRLEEYTTSVREIERRLERADQWLEVERPKVDAADLELDATPRGDAQEYIRAILDLMLEALRTDSTRAITYQITSEDAKGVGDRFPKALGLPGHHSLSHGTGSKGGYEKWARYDRFLSQQLAYFLDRLRATEDPFREGSLLDHTIVFYGCSTSRTHKAVNYPLILAGGTSMGFRHGRYLRLDESRERLSNLYVTFLQRLGIDVDRFADSTGTLSAVLA